MFINSHIYKLTSILPSSPIFLIPLFPIQMKIIDKIEQAQKSNHIAYSFEYFPPKTELVILIMRHVDQAFVFMLPLGFCQSD